MTRSTAAGRKLTNRSAVSNGTRILAGVKGTSALARRYKDIIEDLTAELGGVLGQAESLQVRNAATMQLHAEDLTAKMIRGEAVEPDAIMRATNGAARALSAIRKRKAARQPKSHDLGAYLASKREGVAS